MDNLPAGHEDLGQQQLRHGPRLSRIGGSELFSIQFIHGASTPPVFFAMGTLPLLVQTQGPNSLLCLERTLSVALHSI